MATVLLLVPLKLITVLSLSVETNYFCNNLEIVMYKQVRDLGTNHQNYIISYYAGLITS